MDRRLDLKVTYQCNNSCRLCVQGNKRRRFPDHPPLAHLQKTLKAKRATCREVVFTGGEPTVRPDIFELIACAKGLGYEVQIQTNGRMFAYRDFAKKAVRMGVDSFGISLHGADAKTQDFLSRVPGSFDQVTRGIANLLSLRAVLSTNTVINKYNYRRLLKLVDVLHDLGVMQFQLAYPHILGEARRNRKALVLKKSVVVPYVLKAIERGLAHNMVPKVEAIPACLLGRYKDYLTDCGIPHTWVWEMAGAKDFTAWRKAEGKAHGEMCRSCRLAGVCEGPWCEYVTFYGWDEFRAQ